MRAVMLVGLMLICVNAGASSLTTTMNVAVTSTPTSMPTTSMPTAMPTTAMPTTMPTTAMPTTISPTNIPTTMSPTNIPTSSPTDAPDPIFLDTCLGNPDIKLSHSFLEASSDPFSTQVFFLPPNDNIVFVATLTNVTGHLYRSQDGGRSFTDIISDLDNDPAIDQLRSFFVPVPGDSTRMYVLRGNGNLWNSQDSGATWTKRSDNSQLNIFAISVHPYNPNYVLAYVLAPTCRNGGSPCYYSLYISRDFGANWSEMQQYVQQWRWGNPVDANDETVWYLHWKDKTDRFQDKSTNDLQFSVHLSNGDTQDRFANVNSFAIFDDRNAATVDTLWLSHRPGGNPAISLELHVSIDRAATFSKVTFPSDEPFEAAYRLLDVDQGTTFVHVVHAPNRGNLYVSDLSTGAFQLSLEDQFANGNGADWTQVSGAQGSYISSHYTGPLDLFQQSLSTRDNGRSWSVIEVPQNGNTACRNDPQCNLHILSSIVSPFPPGGLYSDRAAPGVLIGPGKESLYQNVAGTPINTYISINSGGDWSKLRDGIWVPQLSDNGGLLLIGESTSDISINSVDYSFSFGQSWLRCVFMRNAGMRIHNIRVEPDSKRGEFLVHGAYNSSHIMVTHMDFSAFRDTTCAPEDYYAFVPPGTECVLGGRLSYQIRRPNATCFNPVGYQPSPMYVPCTCTREDFTCAFCYIYDTNSGECTVDPTCSTSPIAPPADCQGTYTVPSSLRKIASNRCQGGVETTLLAPRTLQCPVSPTSVPVQTSSQPGIPTQAPTTAAAQASNNTGAVVGGIIGALVGLALIIAIVMLCRKGKRRNAEKEAETGGIQMEANDLA